MEPLRYFLRKKKKNLPEASAPGINNSNKNEGFFVFFSFVCLFQSFFLLHMGSGDSVQLSGLGRRDTHQICLPREKIIGRGQEWKGQK